MNILQYESKIWAAADLLIASGIKQSDFPKFMMPFFALRMVESRLVREMQHLADEGIIKHGKDNDNDYIECFRDLQVGYNDYIVRQDKTLYKICQNDTTAEGDFVNYLRAFDAETQHLLGVEKGSSEEKFLDVSGVCGMMRSKNILFQTLKVWADIDLTPFDNSEITTLEEHIKRKWADISADTAGEQYTPDDIIALISEIVASRIDMNSNDFLTIYDPTCGGGNLLFGIEDKIKKQGASCPIKTFGMDWNSSLFALAKIESRFRPDSEVRYGNTLTDIPYINNRFDVVVANPPYGVDWKGFKKDIEHDKTERFIDTPAVSDGQLLFDQHIAFHLAKKGIAVIVNNGSPLFSGDAGSGESNIRKYFFDNDWVEALIQMPTSEFFNTGIYTYLWVLNKNKTADRKDKVLLIDGSNFWQLLKKSKGDKRREMTAENRQTIVQAYLDGKQTDFCRMFDKWFFYYNKQSIVLTNVDDNGHYLSEPLKFMPAQIQQNDLKISQFSFKSEEYKTLKIAETLEQLDYKEQPLTITDTLGNRYAYNADRETIVCTDKQGNSTDLGCGKIVIKTAYKKAPKTEEDAKETAKAKKETKAKEGIYNVSVTIAPDTVKDYEIIPYNPDPKQNETNIADFMARYVSRPFEYDKNTVGVEINFNKIFYVPEILPAPQTLIADIEALDSQLAQLENNFKL